MIRSSRKKKGSLRFSVDQEKLNELLLGVKKGDEESYNELVRIMKHKLMVLGVSKLADHQEAKDAVQIVYVHLVKRIGSYRNASNPFGWIYQIMRNVCRDLLRKRKKRKQAQQNAVGRFVCRNEEEIFLLNEILNSLEPEEKQFIFLRFWGGLTYREMADQLGLPLITVEREIKRILEKLKSLV